MPTYSVVMGQGVSVADLGSDALNTGWGNRGDLIQSCSAVILVNPTTGAGGLYHFPAGGLTEKDGSRAVFIQMRDRVQPTEAYIVYGAAEHFGSDVAVVPADADHEKLRSLVL